MKTLRYISAALVVMLFLISCGGGEGKVIPRSKMANIYAEMFLTDQWINTPVLRKIADTSLVYEPILEKYGYSSKDYRKTVDVYLDDPERFSRVLRTTGEILDERLKELNDIKERMAHEEAVRKYLAGLKIYVDFKAEEYFPYLFDEPYVHYYDSLSVEQDSMLVYRLKNIELSDTTYQGIRMVVRDSLEIKDSVIVE